MNYSSHTESSLEGGPTAKRRRHSSADLKAHAPLAPVGTVASSSSATQLDAITAPQPPSPTANSATAEVTVGEATPVSAVPKIRVKPQLQRPLSPPETLTPLPPTNPLADPSQLHNFDMQLLKSRDNLVRYYDFMRRFYAGGSMLNQPVLAPPLYGSSLLQSLSFPTTTTSSTTSSTAITTATTTGTTTTTKTTTDNNNPAESKQLSPPKATSPTPSMSASQQLKRSPDSGRTRARSPIASSATPSGSQPQPHTPINLTKLPFSSSRNGQPASTSTPVAVAPLKLELPSPPKPSTDLRIPQLLLRGTPAAEQSAGPPLPPLDLEQLKPITSTYLQLTRSMGLSDEDALRFDNLVSKDFKYTL